jgi:hypothetical protein
VLASLQSALGFSRWFGPRLATLALCSEQQVSGRLYRPAPFWPSFSLYGVDPSTVTLLPYLASEPTTETFRSFLQTHAELLRVAPTWMIRIVFPRPLDHAYHAYQAVIHEELESPLHSATIGELQSYFELRLEAARGGPMHPLNQGFRRKGHEVFTAARFTAMYHRWLKHGNAVFAGPSSPAIAEALNSGRGRVESVVLPHSYRHLSPLVADTPARPELVDKGLRRGREGGQCDRTALTPVLNPLSRNLSSASVSSVSATGIV